MTTVSCVIVVGGVGILPSVVTVLGVGMVCGVVAVRHVVVRCVDRACVFVLRMRLARAVVVRGGHRRFPSALVARG
ncbi:hypothetical protein ACF3NT_12540 [Naumannella halotolerans]|uniref:hypothetical protein n=1 Tax=Naumannella halotolerans TaxID=993414 RepID=UPI0014152D5C|nr:hypothetical protein [Naumannella halotolerans]